MCTFILLLPEELFITVLLIGLSLPLITTQGRRCRVVLVEVYLVFRITIFIYLFIFVIFFCSDLRKKKLRILSSTEDLYYGLCYVPFHLFVSMYF